MEIYSSSHGSGEPEDNPFKKCAAKDGLRIPSLKTGKISLEDIIAATIGEDARFCDDTEQCSEISQDLNFSFYFKDSSHEDNLTNCFSDTNTVINSEVNESSQHSVKYQTVPVTDEHSNTTDSFFKDDNVGKNIATDDFATNLGFETVFENHDAFLSSLVQSCCDDVEKGQSDAVNNERPTNLSSDSDLEDSMHFVDPDDQSTTNTAEFDNDFSEPEPKKRRLSDILPLSTAQCNNLNASNNDLIALLHAEEKEASFINVRQTQKNSSFHRRRSFSGAQGAGLQRQHGFSKLDHNNLKTPTLHRTRSFSEAFNHEKLTPISEGRQLDTSLSSLLGSPNENSKLSNNPFYEDLKCTLLSDLSNSASDDCPKALFDTICQGQKSDVYARERNLQSRFSSLQSKYPDEVRDLSSFYRQQSAEVETERFREIHDERFPISYRNHLNRYYDNLLHMIMERVEKSLHLLSKAKKESVTVVQGFRPRPLLSRKAVSMMEEWYTRNFEHPYPSQTAVEALAAAGEITTEQVKKWFANKRNRNKNVRPMNEVASMKRKRQFSARW